MNIKNLCIGLFISVLLTGVSIYEYSIPGIEGGVKQISSYQGQRILFITLPTQQSLSGDTLLYCLDTLAQHNSQLKIVGIPSIEDGFSASRRDSLKSWYRSKLGTYIYIADGIYTHKESGNQQHPLFKWLTDISLNEMFEVNPAGPGYKYFINQSGSLYGVLHPHTKVSGVAVQRAIHL
jgi:glutathione peroxidase